MLKWIYHHTQFAFLLVFYISLSYEVAQKQWKIAINLNGTLERTSYYFFPISNIFPAIFKK